jgi:hypothetical protein
MANISDLNITPTETLNLDDYATVGGGKKFPVAGRYTLRAAESFPREAFGSNKAGNALTIQIDPTIVGPTNEGYQLRFSSGRISAKTYQRKGKWVSQLGDFLKAVGETGEVPGDPQEQANMVERTAGRVFEAGLDWRAWDPSTQTETEGMENFPSDGNGGHLPYLLSATQKDEDGNPKKIWANLQIVYFVPQS